MDELNELATYTRDTEHDMWVDFDNIEKPVPSNGVEEDSINNFIANLNDWD